MASATAADVKRVALIPFKINAKEDLTYLRDGINDMLSTRLSQNESISVIQRNEVEQAVGAAGLSGAITEAEARGIGSRLGAAFVMIGSLTVLKENVSIDVKMIDIAGHRPTMAFFEQADSLGEVITKINTMAAQINARLTGQTAVAAAPTVSVQQQQKQPPEQKQKPTELDRHAHPEKLLKEGQPDAEGGSPFIVADELQLAGANYWKSPRFKQPINGVALGDVNCDGKLETVIITDHGVMVYGKTSNRFLKIAELPEGDSHNLVGIGVADINDNGTPEIFVSSLDALRTGLNSYVLEYDGNKFVKIVDSSRWYFRVVETTFRGKVLLGQKHRRTNVFSGNLKEMTWQGGDYVPLNNVRTPKSINVLGVAMGDIMDDRQEAIAAFTEDDYITVIDGNGKTVWTGPERMGGSNLYYLIPKTDIGEVETRRFFPMPLLIHNVQNEEKPELVVARNFETVGMKLEQFRKFTGGQIEAFAWDGMGLATMWRTRKFSGFIRDFTIGDFDGDDVEELLAVIVNRTGEAVWSTPNSHLIAYDLILPEKSQNTSNQ
jgi:TolB-like protein